MIHSARMTAAVDGDIVLFLIGMRLNQPWAVHKWLPVARAMPRMLRELYQNPGLGFVSHEMWFSRTLILVQYWRSLDQLMAYASAREAEHLPAWQAFNRAVGTDGSVGIWHETYLSKAGAFESVYANMPPFGLGKVGPLVEAKGPYRSASQRLAAGVEAD
ncbi:MAG: DUF4188 domain-containing protein [Pseudomonadota bacterium]|nr:DUF4188 domain-containing protein [Pseudomonadota bacterium]MED5442658.1 DUF4188 domain-containing protein [Pseudomonadota bacterium]